MIDKVKIYNLIKNQVPEFVREDYPTFIAFLEAYYEYLDTIHVDPKDYRNLETTVDDFIQYFRRELAYNIPKSDFVEDKFLIQRAKDIYEAKGSEASFNLLFRMLFNKDVSVQYPYSQVLKPSDGKWNKDTSIFVRIEYGHPDDIIGRLLEIVSTNRIISVFVDKTETISIDVQGSLQLGENVYEIFIDKNLFSEVSPGDFLQYEDSFKAEILSTTTEVEILNAGTSFKAGQLFPISTENGSGTILKVKRVDSNGAILALEIVRFGLGYSNDFSTTLNPNPNQQSGVGYEIIGNNISFSDVQQSFIETGYVKTNDYNIDVVSPAFEDSYVGEILREFSFVNYGDSGQTEFSGDSAVISLKIGALATYPGYYSTNDGFLSDTIYLHDSRYYQVFSYVLSVDMMLEEYGSIVKDILHPSGMAMFGEYSITNDIDISLYVESVVSVLSQIFDDLFTVSDSVDYSISKLFLDNFDLSTYTYHSLSKVHDTDNFNLSDTNQKLINKAIISDFNLSTNISSIQLDRNLSDNFSLSESLSRSTDKYIDVDFFTLSDSIQVSSTSAKLLSDSTDPITEEGTLFLNPYVVVPSDYWDPTYTEGLTQF